MLVRLMVETRTVQMQGSEKSIRKEENSLFIHLKEAEVRGWLVSQSVPIQVMNARIACPPSGKCSESLSYFIFQELGERQISAVNLSLKVDGSCADGLAGLTLAGSGNLGKEAIGGTQ